MSPPPSISSGPSEIDRQYDISLQISDFGEQLQSLARLSEQARQDLDCVPDLAYGTGDDERCDLFLTTAKQAPVLLFIHGGYWRRCSRKDYSILARGLTACGINVAVMGYSLCPKVKIEDITAQSRQQVAWLVANGARYGLDPKQIILCGHSAGAQQVGMLLATDWASLGVPVEVIRGAVALSGIYDLTPLLKSWLQPTLCLDEQQVAGQSPVRHVPANSKVRLLISYGKAESGEFERQAMGYAAAWQGAGNSVRVWPQEGSDHLQVIEGLMTPESALCREILAMVGQKGGS